MKKFIEQFKNSQFGRWLRKSRLWSFMKKSQGDWRYPFMVMSWKITRLISPRKTVCANGVKFTLPCTNWITHFRWYLFNKKEQEVRQYIDKYVQEGDVFFDVGANIGVFSLYTGKRFNDISIYSFEPEHSNLGILKENIICNKLTDKITAYSAAIGNFNGPSCFHIQDFTPGSAEHSEEKDAISMTREGHKVVWTEGIMSLTLDAICEHLGMVPNVMKIDTDSNEDKVLMGAENTLNNKALRSMILEIPHESEKAEHCRAVLERAGFRVAWAEPEQTRNEVWVR